MRLLWIGCLWLVGLAPVIAQNVDNAIQTATEESPIVDLETVTVSGIQPGPGLWKVSKGDHVLWVLGTLSPLPRKMEWQSQEVRAVIAQAQEVIEPPSITVTSDVGAVRSLLLLPSLMKARRNPEGRQLRDEVSPKLYSRWQVLKARYIGSSNGVEKWRPVFAAQELYEAAIRKSGMTLDNVAQPVVRKAARANGVPMTPVNVKVVIERPKEAIQAFSQETLADTECFTRTLTRIEGDLEAMRARANAWAEGDVQALRDMPYDSQYSACLAALTGSALARKVGLNDIDSRLRQTWLAATEAAVEKNQVSFAMLPMALVTKPTGYLAALQAKGYEVEAP